MEYNVSSLPKEEFLRLWDVVLLAREGINTYTPYYPVALHRVSDRPEDFSESDRPTIAKPDYLGVYYYDGQIWIKSSEPFRDVQDTVLHEIAHHEVPCESHGKTWRKVYGTALALHLCECGFEWDEIHHQIDIMAVAPNRVFRTITDPKEQRSIVLDEISWIVDHAKSKVGVLRERGKFYVS